MKKETGKDLVEFVDQKKEIQKGKNSIEKFKRKVETEILK